MAIQLPDSACGYNSAHPPAHPPAQEVADSLEQQKGKSKGQAKTASAGPDEGHGNGNDTQYRAPGIKRNTNGTWWVQIACRGFKMSTLEPIKSMERVVNLHVALVQIRNSAFARYRSALSDLGALNCAQGSATSDLDTCLVIDDHELLALLHEEPYIPILQTTHSPNNTMGHSPKPTHKSTVKPTHKSTVYLHEAPPTDTQQDQMTPTKSPRPAKRRPRATKTDPRQPKQSPKGQHETPQRVPETLESSPEDPKTIKDAKDEI